jgi:hypothetical protein
MNCKNCGQIVDGKYCCNCGQNTNITKINFANFINEVSESVFQIDKGLFYTLIELIVRPGHSIKEFFDGKRKSHFKPIAYVLTFSTLYFFVSRLSGENTWMNDLNTGFKYNSESNAEIPSILTWFSANFAYATLLLLPIFSLASYLSFLGLGRNYLEHMVVNSYVTGQQAIFYSIFLILKVFIDDIYYLELIPFVVSVSYAFFVFWQLFAKGSRIIIILRSVLTYFIYLILSTGILFIFLIIYKL